MIIALYNIRYTILCGISKIVTYNGKNNLFLKVNIKHMGVFSEA